MEAKKIKEVIVVEGQNDTAAVRRAVTADTIETGGSAVGPHVIARVKRAQKSRGVIILTDPDGAGERIRRIVSREVPGCKHAFLQREEAAGKKGFGVEHASPEAILRALRRVRWEEDAPFSDGVSWERYLEVGLAGKPNSRSLRELVARRLGIGYGNAKQFFRRLHILRVTEEEFEEACSGVGKDETDDR
ncbi:ribonuclease M5 [Melghirimyces profundicolus]|uniref:ribonuclease M5 n=1 Tax=Melghirimyces profundicolus TaxID=1242148 RepID=UPI0011B234B2|nr:ribonuclease M5 [Melghirimyces profundicolus]